MRRLSKNFLSIILSDILRRCLGFLAVAYLARTVGAAGFGTVNIGFAVLAYAVLASTAGVNTYGTREIARGAGSNLIGRITSLRLVGAVIAFTAVFILVKTVVHEVETANVIILFCASVFANALLLDWYFQGKEEMIVVGIGRGLSATVYLLLLFIFVHTSHDLVWVAAAAVAGDLCAMAYSLIAYRRRHDGVRLQFGLGGWRRLAGDSFLLGGGSILANISINLPTLALGVLASSADVGFFSAANKLVFFLLALDRVLGVLLLPAASRISAESKEKLSARLDLALKWIILTALPLSVGGVLLSDRIIVLVYGAQFAEAGQVFRILVWYFFCTMLHTVFTAGLLAVDQERPYTRIMGISALLYSSTVIAGTMVFGVVGTATAVVASELATLMLMRREFLKFISVHEGTHILKSLPAAVMMGFAVYFVPSTSLVISVIGGGAVYCAALFVTKGVTRGDIEALLERV